MAGGVALLSTTCIRRLPIDALLFAKRRMMRPRRASFSVCSRRNVCSRPCAPSHSTMKTILGTWSRAPSRCRGDIDTVVDCLKVLDPNGRQKQHGRRRGYAPSPDGRRHFAGRNMLGCPRPRPILRRPSISASRSVGTPSRPMFIWMSASLLGTCAQTGRGSRPSRMALQSCICADRGAARKRSIMAISRAVAPPSGSRRDSCSPRIDRSLPLDDVDRLVMFARDLFAGDGNTTGHRPSRKSDDVGRIRRNGRAAGSIRASCMATPPELPPLSLRRISARKS